MKILSGILILISAFLSFKHGWEGLTMRAKPETISMLESLGIGKTSGMMIGIVSLAAGLMLLFPSTFFISNFVNAGVILLIICLSLKTGNLKIAVMEIPFFLMPLLMIWLGHPFRE